MLAPSMFSLAATRRAHDTWACRVRAVVDPDRVESLVEDAQHLATTAQPKCAADRVHNHELTPDILRDETFRAVGVHDVNGRDLAISSEAEGGPLAVVVNCIRLQRAGALHGVAPVTGSKLRVRGECLVNE